MTNSRSFKLILASLMLCITLACNVSASSIQLTPTATQQPAETYLGLRSMIITINPLDVGIEPSTEMPNVWGVLMEFRLSNGLVTLVSLADGTTSLYFDNGGGIIGSGEHKEAADASKYLVALAEDYYSRMTPTDDFPLDAQGTIQFYVLTYSGAYTVIVEEDKLTHGQSEFSPLFSAANDVITQVRLLTATEQP